NAQAGLQSANARKQHPRNLFSRRVAWRPPHRRNFHREWTFPRQTNHRRHHVLQRDENGLEKCVACFLCAAACPANCIYIEAAENTADNRISDADRYAKVYNIDYSRCIFCGYCVEACPTDAITHGHGFELAPYDINAMIYRKEKLLEPWPPPKATPRSSTPSPVATTR